MKGSFLGLLLVAVSSCYPVPPAPAPARSATPVRASFEKTGSAAIDQFADNNVPIATIEKASGIIATARLGVELQEFPFDPHPKKVGSAAPGSGAGR